MEQWVRTTFSIVTPFSYDEPKEYLQSDSLLLPLARFLELYGHLSAPPSIGDLVSVDPDNLRGWNGDFEAWRDAGLIAG